MGDLSKGILGTELPLDESKCPNSFGGSVFGTMFGRNCINDAIEPHTCPFAEEINDDGETLCRCCDDCTHECAMDI
jgi:hypothetical protein